MKCECDLCVCARNAIHACHTGPAVRAQASTHPSKPPSPDRPTISPPNTHTHSVASAQSFRGATIVAKDPSTEAPMQEGVWYGPEALLPWDVVYNNDKRVRSGWVGGGVQGVVGNL